MRSLIWILHLFLITAKRNLSKELSCPDRLSPGECLQYYLDQNQMVELAKYAYTLIQEQKNLSLTPDPYYYLGISQFQLNNLPGATTAFATSLKHNDSNLDAWIGFGESLLYQFQVKEAIIAFETMILIKKLTSDVSKLYKARAWCCDFTDRPELVARIHSSLVERLEKNLSLAISPADFAEASNALILQMSRQMAISQLKSKPVLQQVETTSKLKLGFLSSDFGVHPVSSLVRGFLALLDKSKFVVVCFAMTHASSWWKHNITKSIDHMVSLAGRSSQDAAQEIAKYGIHVLVDLNGHTLNSGIRVFTHRPAPIQISYLGYPMTTGLPSVDYFIADRITIPPMDAQYFSENVAYVASTYMVNDHAQLLGHVKEWRRASLEYAGLDSFAISPSMTVFACFCNWQKIDPSIFQAWMNILRRVPDSILWFIKYKAHKEAEANLREAAAIYGINHYDRFAFTNQVSWINHTWIKSAADIVLDTALKNGHTTTNDALWAGLPVITLCGDKMSNRVSASLLNALGLSILSTSSLKEYADLAVEIASSPVLLKGLRHRVNENSYEKPLFDTTGWTQNFQQLIHALWDHQQLQNFQKKFHIFSTSSPVPRSKLHMQSAIEEAGYADAIKAALEEQHPIRLHIGGQISKQGWWTVNIQGDADMRLDMKQLSVFPDNSVTAIYASHVLEHNSFGVHRQVQASLEEWNRILEPNGTLFLSVPDLRVLCELFLTTSSVEDLFRIMRMLYGGQTDEYDFHKVGFDNQIMEVFLSNAKFCHPEQVQSFGLFNDTSELQVNGTRISLNIKTGPCKQDTTTHYTLP